KRVLSMVLPRAVVLLALLAVAILLGGKGRSGKVIKGGSDEGPTWSGKEKPPPLDIPDNLMCVVSSYEGGWILPAHDAGTTRELLNALWSDQNPGTPESIRGYWLPGYEVKFYRDYGSDEQPRFSFEFNDDKQPGVVVVSARGVGTRRFNAAPELAFRLMKHF